MANKKVPCGGFEIDNKTIVEKDGVLSIDTNDVNELKSALQPINNILKLESGAFGNDHINKVTNVARVRNATPIPVNLLFSLALPSGYSMYVFYFDADMTYISTSTLVTSSQRLQFPSGTCYINFSIQLTADPTQDISANVGTIENNLTIVWQNNVDPSLTVSGLGADAKATGDEISEINTKMDGAIISSGLTAGTDLNSIKDVGYYRLGVGNAYDNCPIGKGTRRLLLVIGNKYLSSTNTYQVLYDCTSGRIYLRVYHDSVWDAWSSYTDYLDITAKYALGLNSYRKATDHGGFYDIVGGVNLYQNSPLSFQKSAKEGIVYHNLDIVFSSDGVPFVVHNDTNTDINNVTFKISETTAENIKLHTLGDAEYSWIPQTLAETDNYIKKLGGMIDMVDVSANPILANAQSLPSYYRRYNMHPTWTNWDDQTLRDAFITAGPEFGVYIVTGYRTTSVDANKTILDNIISYISGKSGTKFAINAAASVNYFRQAIEGNDGNGKPYLETLAELGVKIYVYTFNKSNVVNAPAWANGYVSENVNVNYALWSANINSTT